MVHSVPLGHFFFFPPQLPTPCVPRNRTRFATTLYTTHRTIACPTVGTSKVAFRKKSEPNAGTKHFLWSVDRFDIIIFLKPSTWSTTAQRSFQQQQQRLLSLPVHLQTHKTNMCTSRMTMSWQKGGTTLSPTRSTRFNLRMKRSKPPAEFSNQMLYNFASFSDQASFPTLDDDTSIDEQPTKFKPQFYTPEKSIFTDILRSCPPPPFFKDTDKLVKPQHGSPLPEKLLFPEL